MTNLTMRRFGGLMSILMTGLLFIVFLKPAGGSEVH